MRRLLAASVAAPALVLAAAAWAQPYDPYPPQGGDSAYDPGQPEPYDPYADPRYGPGDPDPDGPDAMGPDDDYGPPDYATPPDDRDDDRYGSSPGGDYPNYARPGDYPQGYRPGDEGSPQYRPYETVPPRYDPPAPRYDPPRYDPPWYSSAPPRSMTPPLPQYGGIPDDLIDREDDLERRIRSGEERGLVPPFHVDNLLVQLDSIRAQQEELAQRDGGLNHTTRRFIESRLDRLERNVTW
jgi:hypothetical protein